MPILPLAHFACAHCLHDRAQDSPAFLHDTRGGLKKFDGDPNWVRGLGQGEIEDISRE